MTFSNNTAATAAAEWLMRLDSCLLSTWRRLYSHIRIAVVNHCVCIFAFRNKRIQFHAHADRGLMNNHFIEIFYLLFVDIDIVANEFTMISISGILSQSKDASVWVWVQEIFYSDEFANDSLIKSTIFAKSSQIQFSFRKEKPENLCEE